MEPAAKELETMSGDVPLSLMNPTPQVKYNNMNIQKSVCLNHHLENSCCTMFKLFFSSVLVDFAATSSGKTARPRRLIFIFTIRGLSAYLQFNGYQEHILFIMDREFVATRI